MVQRATTAGTEVPLQGRRADEIPPGTIHAGDCYTALDAVFPAGQSPGAGSVGRNNHPLVGFAADKNEHIYFGNCLAADYNPAATLRMTIFWVAETAIVGDVVWFVAWERDNVAGQDIDADGFAAEKSVTSTAPGASGVIQSGVINFTQAEADAIEAGDPYRIRLRRFGGDGADDMAGDAQLFRLSIEGIP
jgi:hypothetical protein